MKLGVVSFTVMFLLMTCQSIAQQYNTEEKILCKECDSIFEVGFSKLSAVFDNQWIVNKDTVFYIEKASDYLIKNIEYSQIKPSSQSALLVGICSMEALYQELFYYKINRYTILNILPLFKSSLNDLGLGQYVDYENIPKIERNNITKSLLGIYKKSFLSMHQNLEEEKRAYQGYLLWAGAWVELYYITTELHKKISLLPHTSERQAQLDFLTAQLVILKEHQQIILCCLQYFDNRPIIKKISTDLSVAHKNIGEFREAILTTDYFVVK
jgi:hypothetical protein